MQTLAMQSIMSSLGGIFGGIFSTLFGWLSPASAFKPFVPSAMGFEKGGIVPGGIQPFQSGGIVRQPTVGLIGEGRKDEAIIPLEGGAVPVKLIGEQGNITINLSFPGVRSMEDLIDNVSLLDETVANSIDRLRRGARITGDIEVAV